jgi:RhtB (resistance to homoserine/threonine) family protein
MLDMHWFFLWLAWAAINLAATISPGPAFAMTLRTAMAYDRHTGLIMCLGLGLGIAVHVLLVFCGLSYVLTQSVLLFNAIKYMGAAYLIYIGFKAIKAKPKNVVTEDISIKEPARLSIFKSFKMGLLTNVLNPKSMVFFTAMSSQFVSATTPAGLMLAYGLTAVCIEACWFSFVTVVLTHQKVKNRFLSIAHWVERVCGGLLIALGFKLALSKVRV